jgi:hypothetical protein
VGLSPALDARIMAAVATEPAPRVRRRGAAAAWSWLTRPRILRLSPLAGLAAAAALTMLLVWRPAVRGSAAPGPGATEVQFVFVDPQARSVALVGDFNDWEPRANSLVRAAAGGVWTVTVPLEPGRHRYAFIVDGRRWAPDPAAPRASGDDFDAPSSVVTVGGDS